MEDKCNNEATKSDEESSKTCPIIDSVSECASNSSKRDRQEVQKFAYIIIFSLNFIGQLYRLCVYVLYLLRWSKTETSLVQ